jgi:diacylglycerol kinase (ATP)
MVGAIVNPRSGGWRRLHDSHLVHDRAAAVARWLDPEQPDRVRVFEMQAASDGARLAREAMDAGCETLVVVGGDGTINDVLQSLAAEDRVRLGLIPMGTANVLARVLDIPRHDPVRAGQIAMHGMEQRIDLGYTGERWFALVAGIGFDGAVTNAVSRTMKRRIGEWAYVLAAAKVAMRYPRCRITLTLDDGAPEAFDAYLVLIANGGQYAGHYRLGPQVSPSDGLLDVFVCTHRRPLVRGMASDAIALVRNRFHKATGVHHFQASRISLTSDRSMLVELDGDPTGELPLTVQVVPSALRIRVPPRTGD